MRMKLYKLVISDEKGLQKGVFLGQVTLNNGETKVEIANLKLKDKLEELFSKPLDTHYGSPIKDQTATLMKQILPNTPEFFQEVYFELRNVYHFYPEIGESTDL